MLRLLALPVAVLAGPALAHPGHVAADAGHDHYVALAATVLAVVVAGIGFARALIRRRRLRHG